MVTAASAYTGDLVAAAVASPIDWGRLEELATAVLTDDDFPTIRKIGGRGDFGMDAVEEAFFEAERKVRTVIQVTSAQAQVAKLRDTLKKLKKHDIEPVMFVFLTRHPVAASVRREMNDVAAEYRMTLDVRDAQYLVDQLSKTGSTIFARFFGSAESQLNELLARPDPLHAASGRLQHALLATLGAYVLSQRARIARGTLFDKTVLAAIASLGGKTSLESIEAAVKELSPEEIVDKARLAAAIGRLSATGACTVNGATVACSEEAIGNFVAVAKRADAGFSNLLQHIVEKCEAGGKVENAQVGYLERNVRRAMLQLLRVNGPLKADDEADLEFAVDASDEVRATISRDLPPQIGRTALAAFSSYVADSKLAATLAPLVRSYAALAIRNVDPVGRRWQQAALSRSSMAIDTDVVLYLIVEELPEHAPLLRALKALQEQGTEILIPEHVFEEALGHLGRASRTYARFATRLTRFPPALVDSHVWHAVVRGFYYAHRSGFEGSFERYCAKYHIDQDPRGFIEHLLSRRIALKSMKLDEVSPESQQDLYEIEEAVMAFREKSRRKAAFRDPAEMARRVRADVAMAISLAAKASDNLGAPVRGYLTSADQAFRLIERQDAWRPRQPVHIWTRALPEMAAFACATTLADDEAVAFLFNPVTIAAANEMVAEIGMLTSIGVDLKEVPLERLDWDLRGALKQSLDTLEEAVVDAKDDTDRASALAALAVAEKARDIGYSIPPQLAILMDDYGAAVDSVDVERAKRVQAEEQLKAFVQAAREQSSSKGRRKLNRLAKELGIEQGELGEAEDDSGSV